MNDIKPALLILDDEPNVIKAIKRLLFDTDYKIYTASTSKDAMQIFDEHEIQLVISDYRMPEMNGVEFLSRIKKLYPNTVRMILSGYADVQAVVEAINDGQVYKFIAKPWNDQELLTTIMRAFEQYKLKQENEKLYAELENRNKELQEAAESLEEKVKERTHEMEIKNRALSVSHKILDYLPVGVIGIDSDNIVVYINKAAREELRAVDIAPGISAREIIDGSIVNEMLRCLETQENITVQLPDRKGQGLICSPLPQGAGVIGLFCCNNGLQTSYTKDIDKKTEMETLDAGKA